MECDRKHRSIRTVVYLCLYTVYKQRPSRSIIRHHEIHLVSFSVTSIILILAHTTYHALCIAAWWSAVPWRFVGPAIFARPPAGLSCAWPPLPTCGSFPSFGRLIG